MRKIFLLTNNPVLVEKVKEGKDEVLVYDDFMTIFEQLNFHNPDTIIFDFHLVDYEQQFMLESLPKQGEEHYIKLIAIGNSAIKENMADFCQKFVNTTAFNIKNLK